MGQGHYVPTDTPGDLVFNIPPGLWHIASKSVCQRKNPDFDSLALENWTRILV